MAMCVLTKGGGYVEGLKFYLARNGSSRQKNFVQLCPLGWVRSNWLMSLNFFSGWIVVTCWGMYPKALEPWDYPKTRAVIPFITPEGRKLLTLDLITLLCVPVGTQELPFLTHCLSKSSIFSTEGSESQNFPLQKHDLWLCFQAFTSDQRSPYLLLHLPKLLKPTRFYLAATSLSANENVAGF